MAEIRLQRKVPSSWFWVVGLFALLAVVVIWATAADRNVAEESAAGGPYARVVGTSGTAEGAVEEYLAFARAAGTDTRGDMGIDHVFTAEGIRKLRAALQSVVHRHDGRLADARFERFREVADRIQQDPASAMHAGQVRDAFTRAADVLTAFEGAPRARQLRSTAELIRTDQPLLDQRDAVHCFFRESAEAIRAAAGV